MNFRYSVATVYNIEQYIIEPLKMVSVCLMTSNIESLQLMYEYVYLDEEEYE